VSKTAKAAETFCASIDRAVQTAFDDGLFSSEVIGILTVMAQELGLAALGFYAEADSEVDEVEKV